MNLFSKKKWYIITWSYEAGYPSYTDTVKAKNAPEAWCKICKRHGFPLHLIKVKEHQS